MCFKPYCSVLAISSQLILSCFSMVAKGESSFAPVLFPEDFADLRKQHRTDVASDERVVSVCFSGGGSRALVAATSQLAVLFPKYAQQISRVSTVSGGAWAVLGYFMSPEKAGGGYFRETDQ